MATETKGKKPVLVTNIQRYSINDGPGIRTTVFIKGCALECFWCHNPECIHPYEEIRFINEKCTKCGACSVICPEQAVPSPDEVEAGAPKIDRAKCTRCMECVTACKYGALVRAGEPLAVEEILDEVQRDRLFYNNSGGGMTLSGGDPLFVPDFTIELLKGAREAMIHTCLDTCGHVAWHVMGKALDYVDLLLLDIKHMDPVKHKEATGVSNELILENAGKAAKKTKLLIRIPVIPGFNDSAEHIEEVAKFAKSLGNNVVRCDLLPFHNWAEAKYESLGLKYPCCTMESLSAEAVQPLQEIFSAKGLSTQIGG